MIHQRAYKSPTKEASSSDISQDDLKALYYVGGFVLKKLIQFYNNSSPDVVEIIHSFKTDDSLLHAASWTQTLSMGNLMMISDDYFELLIKVESVCYESLSSNNLRNCFLTDFLVESCMASQIIRAMWEKLVGHSDKEFILERLVRFFSRTRAQAYVNHLNRQLQVVTSSASLRQSLVSEKKKRNK